MTVQVLVFLDPSDEDRRHSTLARLQGVAVKPRQIRRRAKALHKPVQLPLQTPQHRAALNNQVPAAQRGQQQSNHHRLDQQAGVTDQAPDRHMFHRRVHGECPLSV
jgi:hypothetical protein